MSLSEPMYKVLITQQVVKEAKKRGKKFHDLVRSIFYLLESNPTPSKSEKLSGEFKFIYSYHFNFAGTAFRLCYSVNALEKIITVIMVGPRENFYQKLRQKLS